MEVVLISVPYTGTNFTAKLFTDIGFQRLGMLDTPDRDAVYVAHALKDTQVLPALELAKTRPVVLPLRHPFRCEESTKRMGSDVEAMILGYENLMRFLPFRPYIMPVDSDKRIKCLEKMKADFDLPLTTDWGVIGSKVCTYSMPFVNIRPSPAVIKLVERYWDFFSLYYDEG